MFVGISEVKWAQILKIEQKTQLTIIKTKGESLWVPILHSRAWKCFKISTISLYSWCLFHDCSRGGKCLVSKFLGGGTITIQGESHNMGGRGVTVKVVAASTKQCR